MLICRLFELLTPFIHKMTLLVAMFAVPGGVYMLNSVFFFKRSLMLAIPSVKRFLSEMWSLYF